MKAEDLRAEIARQRVAIYKIAAEVSVHPSRLSMILHEHLPLPAELGEQIMKIIARKKSSVAL